MNNPDDEVVVDQQTMVLLFFCHGFVSHRTTKDGRQIRFHFLKKEVEEVRTKYLGGETVTVSFDAVVSSMEKWRNAIAFHSN